MSVRTINFLNDVAGGNFTESAPRPPVPGEENERHSSGGTSTRSTGSHKSHHSGKSHSSSKSGVSHRSDVSQSPAATPRRSNLDKSQSHDQSAINKSKLDLDAPLGFEPEGSAASSPPFTENSSPPYLKWAESLNHLLSDSDGVKLFKQFLDQEHNSNSLEFLFACKGLKLVNPSDSQKIQSIVKLIYKKYIKGDQLNLHPEIKKGIVEKLKHIECVDQTIFHAAQNEVETSVKNDTYPLFLKSDLYIQYVQSGGESPKTSNTSSGSNSVRPVSAILPTLREGEELRQEDLRKGPNTSLVLTPSNIMATTMQRVRDSFSRKHEGVFPHPGHRAVNPYHVSYAPPSGQDSEGQSMSSDAQTDDTMSLTDSSVDGREVGAVYGSHLFKKQMRAMKKNAVLNKRSGLAHDFLPPRTERAPKDRNLAETNPERFAAALISKLEKVKEERENFERMKQSMRKIETDEESEESRPANKSLDALLAMADKDREDNAQSILDEHFSRVWENSVGQTPVRTPGRHSPPKSWSPDRSIQRPGAPGPSPNVSGTSFSLNFSSASMSSLQKGLHHKRKPDSLNMLNASLPVDSGVSEDRTTVSLGSDRDSYQKHVHHHHYHNNNHKDSNKLRMLEQEAQNRTMHSISSSTQASRAHQTDSSQLFEESGRSSRKDSKRSANKKSSDSSTVDSGVGLAFDPKLLVPNLHDPSNKKVLAWMLENDQIQTGPTQYSTDNSDKGSSHKKSSHNKSTSSSSKKAAQYSGRSGSVERSALHAGLPGDFPYPAAVGAIQPCQPISQDPSMPLLTPPNPTTQLEEAKRRLQDESKQRITKSRSFTGSAMATSREKRPLPPQVHPATPRSLPINSNKSIPQVAPLDLSSSEEHYAASLPKPDKKRRPSSSAPTTPSPDVTVVAYYIPNEPIPYRTSVQGRNITLGHFKQLVTKKGAFRFFFKMASDEFDCGVVNEEVTDDAAVLPMWEGKIVCRLEKAE